MAAKVLPAQRTSAQAKSGTGTGKAKAFIKLLPLEERVCSTLADTLAMMDATEFEPQAPCALTPFLQELNALEILSAERQRLKHLSFHEAQAILDKLHRLQTDISPFNQSADNNIHRPLFAAICRLSADLSEFLVGHLVDTLHDKQHSIDFLQQELSKKIRDRHAASKLLHRTQALRLQTQTLSDTWQLGSVL